MQSMTGYGRAEYNKDGICLVVELKSVNNRFLDIVPKYPRIFIKYDDLIRKTISQKLNRGRVELFITLKDLREKASEFSVDMSRAKGYYDAYKLLKGQFVELKDDFTLSQLLRAPDIVVEDVDNDDGVYQNILVETLSLALDQLNSMRNVEGDKLKIDLLSRMQTIECLVNLIDERAPQIKENYRQKLEDRLKEALGDYNVDESRLLQEVAIFADKSNIDEELTRLKSHISQFRQIVETDQAGRKLDFLVQEFNRESNTICSKSNDVVITDTALKLKCEIEKVREQIQNIE